jgi:N-acetylneuraminate lyase
MNKDTEWGGIYPAIVTPFQQNGALNETVLRELACFQLQQGAHGFFVCGSAGEGLFMSNDERQRVLEVVLDAVAGNARVIAHVGAMSTRDTAALAEHAAKSGAGAVCTLPPLFLKQPWDACIAHTRAVAHAAQCPTFYYHIPYLTNVTPSVPDLLRMAAEVPHFAGIKYSSGDLRTIWTLLRASNGNLTIFSGSDDVLYQSILTGARGGIGSTYNYQCANVAGIYNATRAGDHANAQQYQDRVNRVIDVLFKHGATRGTEKAITQLLGFDIGAPRLPNQPFPNDQIEQLKRDLHEVGLL